MWRSSAFFALTIACILAMAPNAVAGPCDAECRPGSSTYCLARIAGTCASKVNAGCKQKQNEPCDLYATSASTCANTAHCPGGVLLLRDGNANAAFPKWKAVPDVLHSAAGAPSGIESIAMGTTQGRPYDAIFAKLWSSASSNANPWGSTFYANGAKPVGLAVNDFAHRTRHLLHVHLGTRTAKLRDCARAAAAAINWAANTWSPSAYKGPECDFKGIPTANDGGHPDVWVYLDPAPASGGAPMGVGSAVWAAFIKGPLQSLKAPPSTTDIPAHHTSLAVTRVSNQGKNYFAILLANAAGKRNTGEYQFLESS